MGISDFAQDALGDVVYVEVPEVGAAVTAGEPCSEVESTKSVSDVNAPVSGTIIAVNDALDANPELVNSDPYGEGWFAVIEASEPSQLDNLLTAAGYDLLNDRRPATVHPSPPGSQARRPPWLASSPVLPQGGRRVRGFNPCLRVCL